MERPEDRAPSRRRACSGPWTTRNRKSYSAREIQGLSIPGTPEASLQQGRDLFGDLRGIEFRWLDFIVRGC